MIKNTLISFLCLCLVVGGAEAIDYGIHAFTLRGENISSVKPVNGQVLTYVSNEWKPQTPTTSSGGSGITALTGDVTASGPGSAAATIPNNTITLAKFQDIATARLLGRSTAGTGDPELITIGSNLALVGGVLSASTSSGGVTDHGALTGLLDDDHPQYFNIDGRSGGQNAYGGTDSGDGLNISSTSDGDKGDIRFGDDSVYDESNILWGLGKSTSPQAKVHIYNDENYTNETLRLDSASAKESFFQFDTSTSDNTATTIQTIDASSDDHAYGFHGYINATRTGGASGSAGDAALYRVEGVFKNVSGTVSSIGTVTTPIGESQGGWDVTYSVSGEDILIKVTGATNNNIDWQSNIWTYTVDAD